MKGAAKEINSILPSNLLVYIFQETLSIRVLENIV